MRTIRGPGFIPTARRIARRKGIPVSQVRAERENAGLDLLRAACEQVATNEQYLAAFRINRDDRHQGGGETP